MRYLQNHHYGTKNKIVSTVRHAHVRYRNLPGTVDLHLEFTWWSFPNSSGNLLLWYLAGVWKAPEARQSSCFSMEFIRRPGFPSTFWACPTCWSATAGSEFFHLEPEWWFGSLWFSFDFQILQYLGWWSQDVSQCITCAQCIFFSVAACLYRNQESISRLKGAWEACVNAAPTCATPMSAVWMRGTLPPKTRTCWLTSSSPRCSDAA